jgi:hypothetical protein
MGEGPVIADEVPPTPVATPDLKGGGSVAIVGTPEMLLNS